MSNKRATDAAIALISARQHGVITTGQLEAASLGRSGASSRDQAGTLHRVHRGVYAVGQPRLSREGRWVAAVLAAVRERYSATRAPPRFGSSSASEPVLST